MVSELESLFGSATVLETSERELQKMLRARGIFFGDGLLPTYAYAFLASRERVERWAARAEHLVAAAEGVAKRLVTDLAFFDAMGLSREGLDLVQIDPGYARTCVVCRPDGIPVGNDVKFVEVNSDSPAMMMFLDIVGQCLLELPAFEPLRNKQPMSAADRLLDALVDCYREFGGQHVPTIAITDWEAQKTRFEHLRLAEHFESRGYATIVCDPRSFRLEGGKLHAKDRRIDLVYRRALSAEIIDRRAEVEPLLTAYRDHTVCMVNPLRSYVAGVKSVLSYLAIHEGADCVPNTLLLDTPQARETVMASPSKWVLKKSESHGGNGVVLPGTNEAKWRAALAASRSEVWIAQEYLEVPRLAVPEIAGERVARAEKYFNWNPFMFAGRYAGGMVRVSSTPLINITAGGGLLPMFTT